MNPYFFNSRVSLEKRDIRRQEEFRIIHLVKFERIYFPFITFLTQQRFDLQVQKNVYNCVALYEETMFKNPEIQMEFKRLDQYKYLLYLTLLILCNETSKTG